MDISISTIVTTSIVGSFLFYYFSVWQWGKEKLSVKWVPVL